MTDEINQQRPPDHWRLDRRITIGNVLTIMAIFGGVWTFAADIIAELKTGNTEIKAVTKILDTRLSIVEDRMRDDAERDNQINASIKKIESRLSEMQDYLLHEHDKRATK
jgi:hypothetical protein